MNSFACAFCQESSFLFWQPKISSSTQANIGMKNPYQPFFATFYSTWEECCFLHCTLFENQLRMSHYLMLAFSTNFCSTKISMFNELISTQNVNVALFARNVEWDFFLELTNTVRCLTIFCIDRLSFLQAYPHSNQHLIDFYFHFLTCPIEVSSFGPLIIIFSS